MPDFSHIRPDQVRAYVRLSREDLRGPGTNEQKLADRRQICHNLAKTHGLTLLDSHTHTEQASGTRLSTRPEMLLILEECRQGRCKVLIAPNVSRLLRSGGADLETLENALITGKVTLIAADGITPFDDNYDATHALSFGVQAIVGRHQVARGVKDRKEADRVKLARNERTRGFAPYAYRYLRPTYDAHGVRLTPKAHEIVPAEYAILCEVFQRVRTESLNAIAIDLTTRGVPAPGGGVTWHRSVLRRILLNPWYAGHLGQRYQVGRQGQHIELPFEDYILSSEEGDWPHPITLAEYYEINALLQGRVHPATSRRCLLTGLLYCPAGAGMFGTAQREYRCLCSDDVHHHHFTSRRRVETWARQVVTAVLSALPDNVLKASPTSPANDRPAQEAALRRASRQHHDLDAEVKNLLRQSALLAKRFSGDFEAVIDGVTKERDAAKAEVQRLSTLLAQPEAGQILPVLAKVKAIGIENMWHTDQADTLFPLQRAFLQAVLQRIDLLPVPEGRQHYSDATVTFWDWMTFKVDLPPFPKTTRTDWNCAAHKNAKGHFISHPKPGEPLSPRKDRRKPKPEPNAG